MEAQTLQEQIPVYHVCQNCGGEGCAACSDLLILDGDIQLDPEWDEEIQPASAMAIPSNSSWKPAYEFIVVWKENGQSFNKCFTNESESLAHFEALIGRASSLYMTYPDGQTLSGASK